MLTEVGRFVLHLISHVHLPSFGYDDCTSAPVRNLLNRFVQGNWGNAGGESLNLDLLSLTVVDASRWAPSFSYAYRDSLANPLLLSSTPAMLELPDGYPHSPTDWMYALANGTPFVISYPAHSRRALACRPMFPATSGRYWFGTTGTFRVLDVSPAATTIVQLQGQALILVWPSGTPSQFFQLSGSVGRHADVFLSSANTSYAGSTSAVALGPKQAVTLPPLSCALAIFFCPPSGFSAQLRLDFALDLDDPAPTKAIASLEELSAVAHLDQKRLASFPPLFKAYGALPRWQAYASRGAAWLQHRAERDPVVAVSSVHRA